MNWPLGASVARFDYVLPLDADDMIRPPGRGDVSYLTHGVGLLAADDTLAFTHTGSWMFGEATGPTISSYPLTQDMVIRKHHVPTSILFRRSDLQGGAGYDESIAKWQDWSFGVELLASRWRRGLANRIAFVRGNHHLYRIHRTANRISSAEVDEYAMTLMTVQRNHDYLRHSYDSAASAEQLARLILEAKPTKLTDLLLMARYDMSQAENLIARRNARLVTALDALDIP